MNQISTVWVLGTVQMVASDNPIKRSSFLKKSDQQISRYASLKNYDGFDSDKQRMNAYAR